MKEIAFVTETEFNKARREIKKLNAEGKIIVFSSDNDELNRKIIEKEKINILLLNQHHRKDFQKQRNSGFNEVMARIAKKNNIAIGINLDEIISAENPLKKSEILARVRQNIKLCKKNKIKMKFISLSPENSRDIYDLKALGIVLGMPTWMTKEL